jgi:hypothetical protein
MMQYANRRTGESTVAVALDALGLLSTMNALLMPASFLCGSRNGYKSWPGFKIVKTSPMCVADAEGG